MIDIDFLKSVPLLSEIEDDYLTELAPLFEHVEVAAGGCVIKEGQPVTHLSLVSRGVVHVRREAASKDVLLARIPRCGFFGEMNLFTEGPATASIYAMDTAWLERIPHAKLRDFMERNPGAGYRITAFMLFELSDRLKQTNDRFVNSVYWANTGK